MYVLLIRTNMFPFSLQMVVDIYVNYDCDLSSANIFERLVTFLNYLLLMKIRKIQIFYIVANKCDLATGRGGQVV